MGEARLEEKDNDTGVEEAPFPLTATDRWVLSQTDEEYQLHTWDDLKDIIAMNKLEVLKRKPSDLRRYMEWTFETKRTYGSMTNFLLTNRLPQAWGKPLFTPTSPIPFASPTDYKILINDWPYGLSPEITHIVVWSRTSIETDPITGDVSSQSREKIENFVRKTFVDRLGVEVDGGVHGEEGKWGRPEERVLWFKNWVALQSVRSLEHIHVLVRGAKKNILEEWTGDVVEKA